MFEAESIEITRDLLIALGIEVQPDTNIIIDQETKNQISFDGKFIKANIDPNKAVYVSDRDIRLEPLNPKNTKLMERLFGKFLDDSSSEEIENIPEVLSYFFDKDEENNKNKLNIKFIDGSSWVGNWYYNKILSYVEAIFAIDGTFEDTDLRKFDIEQDY